MVKSYIKIYARLKKEDPVKTVSYDIQKKGKHEDLTLRARNVDCYINNKPLYHRFRFHKIFDQDADQSELFNRVARPVVTSVMRGYNGTIFAYGQTGSGKTYAITGAPDSYHERGIIPRSIEEVFTFIKHDSGSYTICISYLEIYNEIGYDLLNPTQKFACIEELPKIHLLVDGKGGSHLRNLSSQQVTNEREAMQLLFFGDNNRTVAETPMNVCSSRSHCIFTICVTQKNIRSGKIRRSKLNLIDLAGSERVNKSQISGTTLTEAKHINLSLHYLEQVVLALTRSKKGHIPYRNSMLTYLLKDSLAGNCITVLLATLAVNNGNLRESIATCKFAQRVATVDMDAVINEEIDPQHEIEHLRHEIEGLKRELLKYTRSLKVSTKLTPTETENCKRMVISYLNDTKDELEVLHSGDMRHIQLCFQLLKQAVKENEHQRNKLKSAENANTEHVEKYKRIIMEKEEEISILTSLLDTSTKRSNSLLQNTFTSEYCNNYTQNGFGCETPPKSKTKTIAFEPPFELSPSQQNAFESFTKNGENLAEVTYYQESIKNLHKDAKKLQKVIEDCQNRIVGLRYKPCLNSNRLLHKQLVNEQQLYKESLEKIQKLKFESDQLNSSLELSKLKVMKRFKQWYDSNYVASARVLDIPYFYNDCRASRPAEVKGIDDYIVRNSLYNPEFLNQANASPFSKCNDEQIQSSRPSKNYSFADDSKYDQIENDYNANPMLLECRPAMNTEHPDLSNATHQSFDQKVPKHPTDKNLTSLYTRPLRRDSSFFVNDETQINTYLNNAKHCVTAVHNKLQETYQDTSRSEQCYNVERETSCEILHRGQMYHNNIQKESEFNNNRHIILHRCSSPIKLPANGVPAVFPKYSYACHQSSSEGNPTSSTRSYQSLIERYNKQEAKPDPKYLPHSSSDSTVTCSHRNYYPNAAHRYRSTKSPMRHSRPEQSPANSRQPYDDWESKQHFQTSSPKRYTDQEDQQYKELPLKSGNPLPQNKQQQYSDLTQHRCSSPTTFKNQATQQETFFYQSPVDRLFKVDDTKEFITFMQQVPLTGDFEVDDEIVSFYRAKF